MATEPVLFRQGIGDVEPLLRCIGVHHATATSNIKGDRSRRWVGTIKGVRDSDPIGLGPSDRADIDRAD